MAAEHPPPGIPLESSYKNRLQEFTQRASIPLPIYQTFNEGPQHGMIFRSQVWVDEACFVSQNTFPNRKMSEQHAAKLALTGVVEKVKTEGHSRVKEDTIFCKSIINEYTLKMNLGTPIYRTNESKAIVPLFVSTLVLNGVNFIGDPARTKKEAEQFAARSAILSILGSEPGTSMLEIVKSKFKLYNALKKVKDSSIVHAGDLPPVAMPLDDALVSNKGKKVDTSVIQAGETPAVGTPLDSALVPSNKRKKVDTSVIQAGDAPAVATPLEGALISSNKGKEVEVSGGSISDLISAILLSNKFKHSSVIQPSLLSTPAIQLALAGSPHQQPLHEFKKTKLDNTPSVAIDPQQGSENLETSAKGRKRKNRKAKKKMLNNQAMMPVASVPHGQAPVFSVAK